MIEIPERCIETVNHSKIVCVDKTKKAKNDKKPRREMVFYNEEKIPIQRIETDGCVFKEETDKCDFLVRNTDERNYNEYFVELKGSDTQKAVGQIQTTIQKLSRFYELKKEKEYSYSFIVCSNNPMNSTQTQKAMLKMKNDYYSRLYVLSIKGGFDLKTHKPKPVK